MPLSGALVLNFLNIGAHWADDRSEEILASLYFCSKVGCRGYLLSPRSPGNPIFTAILDKNTAIDQSFVDT